MIPEEFHAKCAVIEDMIPEWPLEAFLKLSYLEESLPESGTEKERRIIESLRIEAVGRLLQTRSADF